jgi:endonuclease-3
LTIISQSTNERNTTKAFENLSNKFLVTTETLAKAEIKEIKESLETAGLYRRKSTLIKQVSEIIREKYASDLTYTLSLSLEQARTELLRLPSVGPKTADVVLLFAAKKPTMPVGAHVRQSVKRLDLAHESRNYEGIRVNLQYLFRTRRLLVCSYVAHPAWHGILQSQNTIMLQMTFEQPLSLQKSVQAKTGIS